MTLTLALGAAEPLVGVTCGGVVVATDAGVVEPVVGADAVGVGTAADGVGEVAPGDEEGLLFALVVSGGTTILSPCGPMMVVGADELLFVD